ncbi:cytochrome P450 [Trujillonella endophytica]|uniref:Cytochrome P450 n=1 Tax=Trujillonella endophytica TaxID=673521 RepID=A0A1H8V5I2_9ACTN|nr:cytochrome P450 [Trujillella endophytica]SEP10503.1 Cytochrome P450 [Trujillella endophytica]
MSADTTGLAGPVATPLSDEWCAEHFDYLAPEFGSAVHPTYARLRAQWPITRSDARGGFWVVSRYDDVFRVAQDWETFSSELGVGIPATTMTIPAIPETVDPPLQRVYKKLISAHLTPALVRPHEAATRALVTEMIDRFIEAGTCDFMADLAMPFPGRAFFGMVLNAPPEEVEHVAGLAQQASMPSNPDVKEIWAQLHGWIHAFLEQRRAQPPKGDIVDAILGAEIEGRPISDTEVLGMVLLLILGGLETTAGVLGAAMLRFVREPHVADEIRARPERMPAAVEELLRLDGSFLAIGRTVRQRTELAGTAVEPGEKVYISWASANRDEAEFPEPDAFDLDRRHNRHLAFGAGPHRCVGSNLARMNLTVALTEVLDRLHDVELLEPEETLPFHTAFNRAPMRIPIRFRPGPRRG